MNVTRNLFCWALKVTPLSCVGHTVDTSVERLSLPKTFYNSALLSRLFVSLCLGSGFSHLFVVSSEFLFGRCVCRCLVAQSCPTRCHPMDCKPTRLLCLWGFSRQEHWSGLPMPTSTASSQPRDQNQISRIADGFFTVWATREAQEYWSG